MANVIEYIVRVRDDASGPIEDVSNSTKKAATSAGQSSTKFTALNSKLNLIAMGAKLAAGAVSSITRPMMQISKESISAGATMEKFGTQLEVLMGSSEAAQNRLDELFQIGATTPFELSGLMEAETNLRALGVNAEESLPLIMDFAGAMNVDVAQAAVEVGRAMQFGAGAVETIAGRALSAQVELTTGQNALKMSTEEFRKALVTTLTDPDGKFAGGTSKLAATFQGMVSNLQDAWFKFTKEVAEAGSFDAAKEVLRGMLELIDKNQDGLKVMARVISEGIVKGLLGAVKIAGVLADSFLAATAAVIDLSRKWTETVLELGTTNIVGKLLMSDKEEASLRKRLRRLNDTKEVLQEMGGFATIAQDAGSAVERRIANLPRRGAGTFTTTSGTTGPTPSKPPVLEDDTDSDAVDVDQTLKDLEDSLNDSLQTVVDEMQAAVDELKGLPARMVGGFAKVMTNPGSALANSLGPSGAILTTLADLGSKNPKEIAKQFRSFFKNIVRSLVTVIPELLSTLPVILARNIPFIIMGFLKALPKIVKAFLFDMPVAFLKGILMWWRKAWKDIKYAFSTGGERLGQRGREGRRARGGLAAGAIGGAAACTAVLPGIGTAVGALVGGLIGLIGSKQTGGFIQNDGLFMLHAGERVLPATGAATSSMVQAAGNIGGGQVINIHTNVVDPNSIRQLGILLNREFGSKGRSRGLSIFNNGDPLAGTV